MPRSKARVQEMKYLAPKSLREALTPVAELRRGALASLSGPTDDVRAPARYRRRLVSTFTARAIGGAIEGALERKP
jgi:CO/xanthine dehydrogenase FAD-binding subunit